jgi:hypothetical protein
VTPANELARYVRPDELHTTFNFDALMCEWTAESQRNVIDLTLASTGVVGAPPTWVLANHDTTRVVTRYGRPITGIRFNRDGIDSESFAGIGTVPPGDTDVALGRKRARAAVLLELALPGRAYTSIKVTSWVWRRSRTYPRKFYRTRPGSGPATPYVGGTAAGCRFRGRVLSRRSDSGRSSIRPGCRSLRTGHTDRRRARRSPDQHAEPVSRGTRRALAPSPQQPPRSDPTVRSPKDKPK